MSFYILYNVVSENYSEQYFPCCVERRVKLFELSLLHILHFSTDVTFPCTDIILKLMLPLLNPDSGPMPRNQHVASKTPTTDQTVHVYACYNS